MGHTTGPLSLKKNFSWGFLGNIIYALTQSILLIVIARLASPESVGKYTLALAVIAPIYMFVRMQLNYVYASDLSSGLSFSDYFGFRIISSLLMIGVIFLIAPAISFDKETAYLIVILSISRYFESLSDITYGEMQKQERIDKVGISKILRGLLTIIIFTIILMLSNNLVLATLGLAVCWFFTFIIYDLPNTRAYVSIKPIVKLNHIKTIVIMAIPLAIYQLLLSLNTNMSRYYVGYFFTETELGYFGAVSYIVIASVNPISNALSQSMISKMSKSYYNKKYKKFKSLLFKVLMFAVLTGLIGVLGVFIFGEFLLTILFGEDYASYSNILFIMMFSTIFLFSNSVLALALTSMREFKIQPILGLIWLIKSVLLCSILIPIFGLEGAALSVVLSSFFQLIIRLVFLFYRINKDARKEC